ncbi:AlgP family protein [Stutzerimonas azotifigens]|uniref:AlgP family protein n=1 Tax=Stutzerimonas azotifigens TaxID=291995 RepID=UPI0012686702
MLQQLSFSLVDHLEKACRQARKDAEQTLARLEKQRVKAQTKQSKLQGRLDEAQQASKPKAEAKARASLDELDELLGLLKTRETQTLAYIQRLERDAGASLDLARGITEVGEAAGRALSDASSVTDQPAEARPATSRPAASRAAASKAAAPRPAASKATASKPATPRPAASKAAAPKPDAPKPAASKPAASKPAAPKATAPKPAAKAPAKPARKTSPAKSSPASRKRANGQAGAPSTSTNG